MRFAEFPAGLQAIGIIYALFLNAGKFEIKGGGKLYYSSSLAKAISHFFPSQRSAIGIAVSDNGKPSQCHHLRIRLLES